MFHKFTNSETAAVPVLFAVCQAIGINVDRNWPYNLIGGYIKGEKATVQFSREKRKGDTVVAPRITVWLAKQADVWAAFKAFAEEIPDQKPLPGTIPGISFNVAYREDGGVELLTIYTGSDLGFPYTMYVVDPNQRIPIREKSTGQICLLSSVWITKRLVFVQVREYPNRTAKWDCYTGVPGDCGSAFCPEALEKELINPTIKKGILGLYGKLLEFQEP